MPMAYSSVSVSNHTDGFVQLITTFHAAVETGGDGDIYISGPPGWGFPGSVYPQLGLDGGIKYSEAFGTVRNWHTHSVEGGWSPVNLAHDHVYAVVFEPFHGGVSDGIYERFYVRTPKTDGTGAKIWEGELFDEPNPQVGFSLGQLNFDHYTPGPIAGQVWEGGTGTGTGIWSKSSQNYGGGSDPPQPDPSIIADPTGAGRGQVLKIMEAGLGGGRTVIASYTPPVDMYDGTYRKVTLEWDQWKPNITTVVINEGNSLLDDYYMGSREIELEVRYGIDSAFGIVENGIGSWNGAIYHTGGQVNDSYIIMTTDVWQHIKVVYDFTTMTANMVITTNGVEEHTVHDFGKIPDTFDHNFNQWNNDDWSTEGAGIQEVMLRRCRSLNFQQFGGSSDPAIYYTLIDNLSITAILGNDSIRLFDITLTFGSSTGAIAPNSTAGLSTHDLAVRPVWPEGIRRTPMNSEIDGIVDGYFCFEIADGFFSNSMGGTHQVSVVYWDEVIDAEKPLPYLWLEYDSYGDQMDPDVIFRDAGFPVRLTGTAEWKTATWTVTDAYFGNRQPGGGDFRIHVWPAPVWIMLARVTSVA